MTADRDARREGGAGACPGCGRKARPIVPLLLAAPVLAGLAAAALGSAARGSAWAGQVKWIVGGIFAVLAAGLLWFGLRVVTGVACPSCGRKLAR